MSVLDDLRRAQDQLVNRLQELEPLVSEYQALREEAARLGLAFDTNTTAADAPPATENSPAASAPGGSKRSRRGRGPKKRAGAPAKRQPGGSRGLSREQQLLELIAKSPGITVTAAGKELGVDPTGLYRPVRKLVADKRVDKQGAALHPARAD